MQPQFAANAIDRKRRSTEADQTVSEIRVYEHYQQLPDLNKTRTKRRKNKSKLKVALEAKDLSNDEFFYKTLAKSVPKLSQEARDAVELIEPQGNRDADNPDIDRGVELVQPAKKGVSQVDDDVDDENNRKYVKGTSLGSAEHVSNGDTDVGDNDEDDEGEELHDEEEEEEESDDGAGEGSDEVGKSAYKEEEDDVEQVNEEPPVKRVKFTKEFGSHAELLKEVEQLVKKNEEQDDIGDSDVYWEVKYEHPKYS